MALPVAAWVMTMVGPVVVRAMAALGFTAVTFTGVTVATNSLITLAQSNWSAMPVAVLQIASLSGIPESLGLIAGAFVARLAVWSAINGTKYLLRT